MWHIGGGGNCGFPPYRIQYTECLSRNKRSLLDDLDIVLPFEDITILPGHTVSMVKHSVEADEKLGGDWIHYATNLTRHSNDVQHSGFISFHPSGHRRVSTNANEDGTLDESHRKRAPNGAVAYYGWIDGDTDAFFNRDGGACTDDNTIDALGLRLCNSFLSADMPDGTIVQITDQCFAR